MTRKTHTHFTHGTIDEALAQSRAAMPSDLPDGLSAAGEMVTRVASELCKTMNADSVVIVASQGPNAACAHFGDAPTPKLIATLRELADDLERQIQ